LSRGTPPATIRDVLTSPAEDRAFCGAASAAVGPPRDAKRRQRAGDGLVGGIGSFRGGLWWHTEKARRQYSVIASEINP
jgi:hypothetical protein